ncbi:MAG: amino acid--tRNA ligase-related protein [bacterium]
MRNNYRGVDDVKSFSIVNNLLRQFFLEKGFIEIPTQDRLSILAACEDPETVATYNYLGEVWPLPQTGQMWLEYELLSNPDFPGVFCTSTSYRNEKNPIPGRHKVIFPMFEFESRGTMEDLRILESELLEYLGFGDKNSFPHKTYDSLTEFYSKKELTSAEENKMENDFGKVVFLENFPNYTSPFWNMKKNGDHSNKIDVIISGNETIGSAERSIDKDEMREQFYKISDGKYSGKLYELFGKERVLVELEDFLSLTFTPRFGAGIGMTRLIDGMKKQGLL